MKLSRYKRDLPVSYALGATLVYELLKTHPELIQRVFLRKNIKPGDDLILLIENLKARQIEVVESPKAFNVLDAKENCLMIAEFQKPRTVLATTPNEPQLVLVNPSDAGNLGTIMRSAAAFGFRDIAIVTPAVDYLNPKTIRASMGAVFHLNIQEYTSFDVYCASQPTRTLYAFMLDENATKLPDIKLNSRDFALIFGNEASGLPKSYAAVAQPVFIPQTSSVDSLNLSVATSIALYHFRQK